MRPDKRLLNTDFEKYQLCSGITPIISEIRLKNAIYRQEPNNDQESLLEAKLFAYHNHLFKNPYDTSCWFVDKDFVVWRLRKDNALDQMCLLHSKTGSSNLLYNPSIGFTCNKIAVVSDGGNCLILITEDEQKCVKSISLQGAEPGVILDVQYVETTSRLIIALCAIACDGKKKCSRISLLSYNWQNENVEFLETIHTEILKVPGYVEYLRIEGNGDYLHSIAEDSIIFESPKSLNKPCENTVEDVKDDSGQSERQPKYCWTQDEDSISLWIKIEQQYRDRVKIKVTPTELLIMWNNSLLLQGRFQHRLEEDLTTWKYEEDKLRMELVKYENGLMWNELFIGDKDGQYLPNEALAAEIHARLAHLCSETLENGGQPCLGFNANQLEECDIKDKGSILQRLNINTQENTHLAMLGSSSYVLYTFKMKTGHAICLRYENDGCVWKIQPHDDSWDISHEYTYPVFGYVEASKRNKKFCVAPVNGTYVAILEHTRYIFLYERPNSDITVGRQWLLDLGPDSLPIMGAAATNNYLIVLSTDKVYRLQIYT